MNKMKTRIVLGAAVLLLVTAAAQPARAACSAPTVLGTVEGIGVESQIMTDAFYATAGPSPYYPGQWYSYAGPPVDTGSLVGVWWGLGTGNPASGAGDDNGTFDVSRWLDFYYGQGPSGTFYYGAYLAPGGVTGWSASAEIDGCILNQPVGQRCTCMMLTQQAPGDVPRFILMGARAGDTGNTFFNLPNNAPLLMTEIPKPSIVSSLRDPATFDVTLGVTVGRPAIGVYEQDGCDCALSFRVREIVQTRGLAPPTSRDVADWAGDTNPVDAADTTSTVTSLCGTTNTDVYLATELAPDPASGFTSPLVSELASRIECGPNLAEPTPDKERVPKARPQRGGRTGR